MKMNALIVGDAVYSGKTKESLSQVFDVTYLTNREFEKKSNLDYKKFSFLWIHVETILTLEKIMLFSDSIVVATTSTGHTHLSSEVISLLKERFFSLKSENVLLKSITSTAELAFMLILMGLTRVTCAIEDVQGGNWNRLPNSREKQVANTTIGLIGFGRLGSMVANYAKAFNSKVIIWETNSERREHATLLGYEVAKNIESLVQNSDAISIHINATPERPPVIDEKLLKLAKENVVIVNTSRGSVVDEASISNFITKNPGSFYLTDVISSEESGVELQHSLIWNLSKKIDRVVITPHIGGASRDAMELCEENIFNRVCNFLQVNRQHA